MDISPLWVLDLSAETWFPTDNKPHSEHDCEIAAVRQDEGYLVMGQHDLEMGNDQILRTYDIMFNTLGAELDAGISKEVLAGESIFPNGMRVNSVQMGRGFEKDKQIFVYFDSRDEFIAFLEKVSPAIHFSTGATWILPQLDSSENVRQMREFIACIRAS